ncbi:membrane protein insertion efficiency factor YidD [Halocynthiibacter sp. C4]|uniref:membrane protein insertion efficiency factor YidD n=1 Tax=Halocynthiibacter sp. C4 TaxID=2992758 RepID=UPI00237B16B9|nr:membrane protein insertion efficiency factor YidD [Halocynthiibacter sp. C4]MDE0588494.1 membrane protein insertion efficiency factor YidD [Halocynthiibacter sp. C4]
MGPIAFVISLPIRAYRTVFSPWVGFNCRYQPTCSAYAMEALEKHGAFKGSYLAARRIWRCHPFGKSGYDPVPDNDKKQPPC